MSCCATRSATIRLSSAASRSPCFEHRTTRSPGAIREQLPHRHQPSARRGAQRIAAGADSHCRVATVTQSLSPGFPLPGAPCLWRRSNGDAPGPTGLGRETSPRSPLRWHAVSRHERQRDHHDGWGDVIEFVVLRSSGNDCRGPLYGAAERSARAIHLTIRTAAARGEVTLTVPRATTLDSSFCVLPRKHHRDSPITRERAHDHVVCVMGGGAIPPAATSRRLR